MHSGTAGLRKDRAVTLDNPEEFNSLATRCFCWLSAWHDPCGDEHQVVLEALLQPSCGKSPRRSTSRVP